MTQAMAPDTIQSSDGADRGAGWRWGLLEWALIFVVFFLHAGWPVPEPNEPYYLGKAIHYWQPDWIEGDFFLETADAHTLFYFTFGWLALWLPPAALAWTGRVLTWGLLAWGWQRLSRAVVPRPGWSVLAAGLLVTCLEYCHLAGEWVIGGVEAKGFAWAMVFFGLADMVRGRWNRCWLLLGVASALHVLVGGWSVVAAGAAWLIARRRREGAVVCQRKEDGASATGVPREHHGSSLPPGQGQRERPHGRDARGTHQNTADGSLATMLPGLLGGGAIALLGLLPTLLLNRDVPPRIIAWANEIYVYVRLGHHLTLDVIPTYFLARFAALTAGWVVLWVLTTWLPTPARRPRVRAIHWFVAAAVGVAGLGAVISLTQPFGPRWTASLLRFYWFRLADVAVPMGVALAAIELASGCLAVSHRRSAVRGGRWPGYAVTGAALLVSVAYLGTRLWQISYLQPPRSFRVTSRCDFPGRLEDFVAWRDICWQIAQSSEVPPSARFLTPRLSQTFKWYARRPEVVNWKEIPQDASGIVQWWRRIRKIHTRAIPGPYLYWYDSLAEQGPARLRGLGKRYNARYVVTRARPALPLPVVLRNDRYVVYELN